MPREPSILVKCLLLVGACNSYANSRSGGDSSRVICSAFMCRSGPACFSSSSREDSIPMRTALQGIMLPWQQDGLEKKKKNGKTRLRPPSNMEGGPVLSAKTPSALPIIFASRLDELQERKDKQQSRPRNVRFTSPLLDFGYPLAVLEHESDVLHEKPLLLYLPGFDGSFLSPFLQFPELGTVFDVRCMNIGEDDRSTLEELRDTVLAYLCLELGIESSIQEFQQSMTPTQSQAPVSEVSLEDGSNSTVESKGNFFTNLFGNSDKGSNSKPSKKVNNNRIRQDQNRAVYLVGESFGGILGLEVALAILNHEGDKPRKVQPLLNLQGLTLINAATCYDRSKLAAAGPPVAKLHPLLYPAGLLKLLSLFTDEYSVAQLLLILQAKALPSVIDTAAREAYLGRVAFSLPVSLPKMPQGTLQWRLSEWLEAGCARMASRLAGFGEHENFRTLIIAGENDAALPSIAEAERLASILPDNRVHVVEGAGHASTCGSRIDLTAVMRNRFKELRKNSGGGIFKRNAAAAASRIQMKERALAGKGEYFGMEPRYDNATIGLNPLLYWSRQYYRKGPSTSVSYVGPQTIAATNELSRASHDMVGAKENPFNSQQAGGQDE